MARHSFTPLTFPSLRRVIELFQARAKERKALGARGRALHIHTHTHTHHHTQMHVHFMDTPCLHAQWTLLRIKGVISQWVRVRSLSVESLPRQIRTRRVGIPGCCGTPLLVTSLIIITLRQLVICQLHLHVSHLAVLARLKRQCPYAYPSHNVAMPLSGQHDRGMSIIGDTHSAGEVVLVTATRGDEMRQWCNAGIGILVIRS